MVVLPLLHPALRSAPTILGLGLSLARNKSHIPFIAVLCGVHTASSPLPPSLAPALPRASTAPPTISTRVDISWHATQHHKLCVYKLSRANFETENKSQILAHWIYNNTRHRKTDITRNEKPKKTKNNKQNEGGKAKQLKIHTTGTCTGRPGGVSGYPRAWYRSVS